MSSWRVIIISFIFAVLVIIKGCVLHPTNQCFKDASCITDLGLIAGHLKVGEELIKQGTPIQAEPHFAHPVKELFNNVKNKIQEQGIELNKQTLEDLDKLVQQKPSNREINNKLNKIYDDINKLINLEKQSLKKILNVIQNILKEAEKHYKVSVTGDKPSNIRVVKNTIVEYEDVRGFVVYADEIYQKIPSIEKEKYYQLDEEIQKSFKTIKSLIPLNPPENCLKSLNETSECSLKSVDEISISSLIENLKRASSRL